MVIIWKHGRSNELFSLLFAWDIIFNWNILGLSILSFDENFLDRFLRLLADYDWTFSPLIVDINNDLTPNDKKEIYVSSVVDRNHLFCWVSLFYKISLYPLFDGHLLDMIFQDNFTLSRKGHEVNTQNISPSMFLATSYDKASEAWTRFAPNSLVSGSSQ